MSGADGPADENKPETIETQIQDHSSADSDPSATKNSAAACGVSPIDGTTNQAPKFIGPYRLLRRLGEGGMGQVWLAEQTEPVRRTVALKLIKFGMYDDEVLQRFRSERQSLAIMDHPAIAKVFDAGAAVDGQPYFVMEYVPGVPITEYCDEKRLTVKHRLELFIKVCEGVQHAHQKAIIHRDLKPANILVAEVDGNPMPRIIDFGLAKAVRAEIGDETMMTRIGGFVGTPGYMSPEQADPRVLDVDTRTDVYSLGVVLYVLLTGDQPFDTGRWKRQPLHQVLRELHEVDPPRPSTKIQMEKPSSAARAELRGVHARQLESLLHGDLDWITMKALEKDRARRYGTPTELAADISRYLAHESIVARPASLAYRLQKYIRRHRVGVALGAGGVLLLAGFAFMQTAQVRRVTRERDRASRITNFMSGMFKVSDPGQARGNNITAREILDKASKEIEAGLANDPETQAEMMGIMAVVYHNLGLYPRAQALLERAVEIQRRTLGSKNPQTLNSMNDLCSLLSDAGHFAEAEKIGRETLEIRRQVLGPEHPDTLRSMRDLSMSIENQGRFAEAEKLLREELEIANRVFGLDDPSRARTVLYLAEVLHDEGHFAEAEKFAREALDLHRRVLGPDHPNTLRAIMVLANSVEQQGRYAEAENLDREVLESSRRVFGPESPDTLGTMANLAGTLIYEQRYAEAEKLSRETLDIERRVLGPEHLSTLKTISILVGTLSQEKRYAEAEKMGREVLAMDRRVLGPEHPETALITYNLSCIAALQGHKEEALSLLREAVEHGIGATVDVGQDPDLKSLHRDPRLAVLAARAKEKAGTAQKQN